MSHYQYVAYVKAAIRESIPTVCLIEPMIYYVHFHNPFPFIDTGVLGMLDLLLLTSLSPEQAGYVSVMQNSAHGLMQVLNEILDFSNIQAGHLKLEVVDFHIGELLEQVPFLALEHYYGV